MRHGQHHRVGPCGFVALGDLLSHGAGKMEMIIKTVWIEREVRRHDDEFVALVMGRSTLPYTKRECIRYCAVARPYERRARSRCPNGVGYGLCSPTATGSRKDLLTRSAAELPGNPIFPDKRSSVMPANSIQAIALGCRYGFSLSSGIEHLPAPPCSGPQEVAWLKSRPPGQHPTAP